MVRVLGRRAGFLQHGSDKQGEIELLFSWGIGTRVPGVGTTTLLLVNIL